MYRIALSTSSLKLGIRYQVSGVRKFLLIPVICLLSASCGFHPVYGKTETNNVSAQLASVRVENIPGREGQILENRLTDLLNPGNTGAAPAYSLRITLKNQRSELGINRNLRVTRYDVIPNVDYSLVTLADNKEVDSGHITIKSSYNRTTSEFATYVAEQNAAQLADQEMAEELRSRLIYYFSK